MRITLSAAVSIDGYLDDATPERLVLSSEADLAEVHALRAASDVILVGAGTVRRDDPSLTVRRELVERYGTSEAGGDPIKVTVTRSGDLPPSARFFTTGAAARLVLCPDPVATALRERLGTSAEVIGLGPAEAISAAGIVEVLGARGLSSLMVEGGASILTMFLAEGMADELRLAVAPLLVGDPAAPRLVGAGRFAHDALHRARVLETKTLGDTAVIRFGLDRNSGARNSGDRRAGDGG